MEEEIQWVADSAGVCWGRRSRREEGKKNKVNTARRGAAGWTWSSCGCLPARRPIGPSAVRPFLRSCLCSFLLSIINSHDQVDKRVAGMGLGQWPKQGEIEWPFACKSMLLQSYYVLLYILASRRQYQINIWIIVIQKFSIVKLKALISSNGPFKKHIIKNQVCAGPVNWYTIGLPIDSLGNLTHNNNSQR